jgi:prepilin-type N-terminal cleavage/methylation domain-containing protein
MTEHTLNRGKRRARQGFTLIEMLVVLAIAAIVTSITLGGFREMTQGNKRVSCQTNLTQIYQACRLYAADEGGKFPFYADTSSATPGQADCANTNNNSGIGLWSLYTYPAANNKSLPAPPGFTNDKPINRYIKSSKILHCPEHFAHRSLFTDDNRNTYDDSYLSYQSCDDAKKTPTDMSDDYPTYSSVRPDTPSVTNSWKRQLIVYEGSTYIDRQPADDTIVTWCPYHRGSRDYDNVLFYDGSVQLLARDKDGAYGWERTPKALN